MKRTSAFLIVGLVSLGKIAAHPPSMDIGTFAIDDYSGNGGGLNNMNFMIGSAQNFYWAASANIPGYSAANCAAPTYALDFRNTQVTKSAIATTNSFYGSRGYSDFIYYGGHGINSALYLGAGGSYGQVNPADLNLGAGYNRWLLTNSCSLMNTSNPAATWQPAFKGLKAMLGFKSAVFDNNLSWDLYNTFWYNWTYREQSLLNAFFDAEVNYGYKHLYPGKGLEPGCLSAEVPSTRIDYCREAFKYVNHDYNPAAANTGYFYSKVIGSPQY